jgi:putative tryptophan/tyrosine transport system substrate-binding protein
MRRRDFIAGLGSAAAASPLVARAQQGERVRRVGVLLFGAENDPIFQALFGALRERLQRLGWIEGRNLHLDVRFNAADANRMRESAQELISLAPDVIVVGSATGTRAVQERTQTIPIVFVSVGDPVASGLVGSTARPEGNTTGFTNLFPSIAGKWLALLKEAAPHVSRFALIFNPQFPVTGIYLDAIDKPAATLAVKAIRTPVRSASEIERAIEAFATEPNGGLIVIPPPLDRADRELIVRLTTHHRLPTMSPDRQYGEGSLMTYGPDGVDLYRGAASYVDSILRGAKPHDLPVQFPTKFKLVINLKIAKAIGLDVPPTLRALADEVIE